MKVRVTNPAENPAENPAACASCGFGVPKPPAGGGTSRERFLWAASQVGRPIVNPDEGPKGYGMARQFRPKGRQENSSSDTVCAWYEKTQGKASWCCYFGGGTLLTCTPGDIDIPPGNELPPPKAVPQGRGFVPRTQARSPSRNPNDLVPRTPPVMLTRRRANRMANCGTVQNPPPFPMGMGRGGRLDYATTYGMFPPGYDPYGGYSGVGYAPPAPGVPVAFPMAPPGVYMQGQGCYSASDCGPDEYCHQGMCFPVPGLRNVGVTQVSSIGGRPVHQNPAPLTEFTRSLAPPGFFVR